MKPTDYNFSTIHLGTYNPNLIEAVVCVIPQSLKNYLFLNQPYKFDVVEDGEFVAYVRESVLEKIQKIKSLIYSRLMNIVKRWENGSFHSKDVIEFLEWDYVDGDGSFNKVLYRNKNRYSFYTGFNDKRIARGCPDISPGYRFNLFFNPSPFSLSLKMLKCFARSLQENCKQSDLEREFGKEFVKEMIGKPRNPVEQMNYKAFEEKFLQIVYEYEKTRSNLYNENLGDLTKFSELMWRLNNAENECKEKVAELRKSFGI